MPENGKTLGQIPKRYHGIYVNKNDESRLYISEYFIVREYDFDLKMHRDSLDRNDTLIGDSLINKNTGEGAIVNFDGDYLKHHIHFLDIVFTATPSNIIKKYKGCLFLNTMSYDGGYEVEQVKLKKGILEVNSISTKEEIEMLNEFEENSSDTIASPYSPSKREFRKFIRTEGFLEGGGVCEDQIAKSLKPILSSVLAM